MGRFCAVVVTRGGTDVEIAVAMAPHARKDCGYRWAFWRLGGYWGGALILKPGATGRTGLFGPTYAPDGVILGVTPMDPIGDGVDVARKRDIAGVDPAALADDFAGTPLIFDGTWDEPDDPERPRPLLDDQLAHVPDDMFVAIVDCKG